MRHLPPVTWDDLVTRADLALTEDDITRLNEVAGSLKLKGGLTVAVEAMRR